MIDNYFSVMFSFTYLDVHISDFVPLLEMAGSIPLLGSGCIGGAVAYVHLKYKVVKQRYTFTSISIFTSVRNQLYGKDILPIYQYLQAHCMLHTLEEAAVAVQMISGIKIITICINFLKL